jgi:ubiquinone/menaquinone biosynthesis C-methylase UbiE
MINTIERKYCTASSEFHNPSYQGFCPICSEWSLSLVDFDLGFGKYFTMVYCPKCKSHPRHRLLYIYLKRIFDNYDGPVNLLHFAPETGLTNLLNSYPNINYLSIDLIDENAMQKEDITNLSFKEETFDFILNIHVLEHIANEKKALSELLRVLKPGGAALIGVPIIVEQIKTFEDNTITDPNERARLFGQHDHVRSNGRDFIKRLEKSGFAVFPVFANDYLNVEDTIKFGIYKDYFFLCFKGSGSLSFSIEKESLFKNLRNKEVLNILGKKNCYLIDVLGSKEVFLGQEAEFELQYLTKTPKRLLFGLFDGIVPEELTHKNYLDILPEENKTQFKLKIEKKYVGKNKQMNMLVRVLYLNNEYYEIMDEVVLELTIHTFMGYVFKKLFTLLDRLNFGRHKINNHFQ